MKNTQEKDKRAETHELVVKKFNRILKMLLKTCGVGTDLQRINVYPSCFVFIKKFLKNPPNSPLLNCCMVGGCWVYRTPQLNLLQKNKLKAAWKETFKVIK